MNSILIKLLPVLFGLMSRELLDAMDTAAQKTKNPWDDIIVDVLKFIRGPLP